ncbi:hypothetical protein S245_001936 [Arachis hypogaea]
MKRFSNTLYLPHDIWVAITVKIASNSIKDLCSLRMTCNAAREVGDEDIVNTSISIPALHAMRWWWYRDPDAIRFFNRCMESGHPKLLFRETLRELYMRCNHVIGLEMLQNVASKGHEAVKYALSMMLLLRRDDKEAKKNGIELFHALDAAGLLTCVKQGALGFCQFRGHLKSKCLK